MSAEGFNITTKDAVDQLCRALKADPGYWLSWQANIAVSFQDAVQGSNLYDPSRREDVHRLSNEAADNFLKLLTRNV